MIIYPIEVFIETVFSVSMEMIPSAGYSIIFVSIAVQLLVLPMYRRADELQNEERNRQKEMSPTVKHIKETFHGDERIMMLSTFYREMEYHQYYQLRSLLPLLLQIPFFMAAYNFLSTCPALDGASFYFLTDMGSPDGLLNIGGITINIMPIAMTVINIVSGMIYSRGFELKDKVQLCLTASVFLILLYDSPSGLVFYWTLNNIFSLLKNIFMKLVKHPKEIVSIISVLFVLGYCFKCYTYGSLSTESGKIVAVILLLVGFIPLISLIMDKHSKSLDSCPIPSDNITIFRLSGLIASITLGLLIPVVTIASSPAEFVVRGHYVNPLTLAVYSFVVAIGIFVVWGNIIIAFYSNRAKGVLCFCMFALSLSGLVNSQFFKKHLNNMSIHMQYNKVLEISATDKIINLFVLLGIICIAYILYRFNKKATKIFCIAIIAAIITISGYNMVKIQRTIDSTAHLKDDAYYTHNDAHFTLDRNGRNVIVFMIDRAIGPYVPYIFHERPELEEVYSGFTYYPNMISHACHTMTGAPGLLGGYDYVPYKIKDMVNDEYTEYKKTCLNVMPTLFSENGYKCTILDSPIPLGSESLEEYYHRIDPNIDAYYAMGVVKTEEDAAKDYEYIRRTGKETYIRHSIFLASPLFLRMWLYDDGSYHLQNYIYDRVTLSNNISELDMLSDMTRISDNGDNTYTFIVNETPHCFGMLQMPDYTIEDDVDNTEYLDAWRDNLSETPVDESISMYTEWQQLSYGVNITALIRIGKWIEYLKQNDLYDNTRIILVSDHGFYPFAFDYLTFDKGDGSVDLERIAALLMVKDFGDGTFQTDEEFMTNADVPTIAMDGLIKDPVNPNTGNPINSNNKLTQKQYIFDDNDWLSVHDDMRVMSNWNLENVDFLNKEIMIDD